MKASLPHPASRPSPGRREWVESLRETPTSAVAVFALVLGIYFASPGPERLAGWLLLWPYTVVVARIYGLNPWLIAAYSTAMLTCCMLAPDVGVPLVFAGMSYVVLGNYAGEAAEQEAEQQRLAFDTEMASGRSARLQLARDIHDGLGAHVTAAVLQVRVARASAEKEPRRAKEALKRARVLLDASAADVAAIQSTQDAVSLSWPEAGAELKALAVDLVETAGAELHVESSLPSDGALDANTWAGLRCVVQAALSNVALHARARTVRFLLDRAEADVRVVIEDDGEGFEETRSGFGVAGIRARAQSLGGSASWSAGPGIGTRFELRLPLGGSQ